MLFADEAVERSLTKPDGERLWPNTTRFLDNVQSLAAGQSSAEMDITNMLVMD